MFILSGLKDGQQLRTETDSQAVTNGVVECTGIWKEEDWKTANEKSGKRYVEALLLEWAQTLTITLCLI